MFVNTGIKLFVVVLCFIGSSAYFAHLGFRTSPVLYPPIAMDMFSDYNRSNDSLFSYEPERGG